MPSKAPHRAQRLLDHLRGRPIVWSDSRYRRKLEAIEAKACELESVSDGELQARAGHLRVQSRDGGLSGPGIVAGFALVREAAHRTIGLRPYRAQLHAGLVLYEGNLAEMQTGEGKTLAAVPPAWLRAPEGRGVHVLTFNDYTSRARRAPPALPDGEPLDAGSHRRLTSETKEKEVSATGSPTFGR
jgi:preprotein translocase subunit SecA